MGFPAQLLEPWKKAQDHHDVCQPDQEVDWIQPQSAGGRLGPWLVQLAALIPFGSRGAIVEQACSQFKIPWFLCAAIPQQQFTKDQVWTATSAKLHHGASIHNTDFVLVSSTNAYKWQVARMEHHFGVQGVVYSIVTFCTCTEYVYSSHSAQVQIQDQLQLIETSSILCPLIYAEEERATRVLIPWAYRPSKDWMPLMQENQCFPGAQCSALSCVCDMELLGACSTQCFHIFMLQMKLHKTHVLYAILVPSQHCVLSKTQHLVLSNHQHWQPWENALQGEAPQEPAGQVPAHGAPDQGAWTNLDAWGPPHPLP